jgi:YbgC/YbaW family acyl-CoA thioester hydrolase
MPKVFTKTYRTRYSEINANGLLDPANCARYIIDTAYDWGEILGLGYTVSNELGLYWVIRENEINLFNSLHFMEEFDFTIWMYEWKRVRGRRAFDMKRKSDGELIANGVQQLVCMDCKTLRPVIPPEELIKKFRLENPQEIPSQRFPRISTAPETALTFQQKVAWQDVDMLDMVNNAVYISYAEEAAARTLAVYGWSPSELKGCGIAMAIKRLHIQYQIPAVWGDLLDMTTFLLQLTDTGISLYVGMTRASDGESIANCVLDCYLIDLEDEEARPLPEALVNDLSETLIPVKYD